MIVDGENNLPHRPCRLILVLWLFLGLALVARVSLGQEPGRQTNVEGLLSPVATTPPTPELIQDTLPATAFAMVGDEVVFSTVFSDSPDAIFQWEKISGAGGLEIPGATNMTLQLTNVQLADTASYRLKAIVSTKSQAILYTSARPLVIVGLPAPVNNIVTLLAAQTGLGGTTTFTPTWTVATNNLIAGQSPSSTIGNFSEEMPGRNVSSLTAGGSLALTKIAGTTFYTSSTNYVTCGNGTNAGSMVTYALAGSSNGYDLTGITVYGGWADSGRDQQAYTVYYSTVQAPDLLIPLGTVNYTPADPANGQSATRVTLRPVNGTLARNVAAVKFNFTSPASKNGFCGYAQIVLSGHPSTTPAQLESPAERQVLIGTNVNSAHDSLDLLGSWIWAANTYDGQVCQFWRTFEIPAAANVVKARLVMTVDNEFTLYLDGRELGRGAEWRELYVFDVTQLLSPGRHILAVRAVNSFGFAGMLFGLRVDLADGRMIEVKSDNRWRIVPEGVRHWEERTEAAAGWPAATIKAPLGGSPWWDQPMQVNKLPPSLPIKVFFWQTAWFQAAFLTLCGGLLLTVFFLVAQLMLQQKERWLLKRERARIAMDIHDDIGSRITRLVVSGEDTEAKLPADSPARLELAAIWDGARAVLSSLDEILWALNPRLDTLRHFANYVCDYASKVLGPSGIVCEFEVDPKMQLTEADMPLRRSLLMAIKETLNNVVKHAGATEVRLKIERQRQRLLVVVQDNGKGFDPAGSKPGRNGLNNMSGRMRELGGDCHISSQPGKGCRIEFNIPLKRSHRFQWFRK